jgi:L-fuconolactonase
MPKIDSHAHFWQLARGDYCWMSPDIPALQRDYGAADFGALRRANDIESIVLVQAAPTIEETQFILRLANDCDFVAAVIGRVDVETGSTLEQLAALKKEPLFRGIRPMLRDMQHNSWLTLPDLHDTLSCLEDTGLTFECMLRPCQLDTAIPVLQQHPRLHAILSHGGMPDISAGHYDQWAHGIRAIAEETTVDCKLSGLATQAGEDWSGDALRSYFDLLLSCFGPDRLIWGSDWPVLLSVSTYTRWCNVCTELLRELDDTEQRAIFHDNAKRFYRLN